MTALQEAFDKLFTRIKNTPLQEIRDSRFKNRIEFELDQLEEIKKLVDIPYPPLDTALKQAQDNVEQFYAPTGFGAFSAGADFYTKGGAPDIDALVREYVPLDSHKEIIDKYELNVPIRPSIAGAAGSGPPLRRRNSFGKRRRSRIHKGKRRSFRKRYNKIRK